ncbi:MAG: hypothetical protein DRP74_08040 [Candidatus Omnitrophota bacterium]|nr:MAG: hypothetical protein DRP74_08040 [Candidatus Omnitrophota bacterium]
MNKRASALILGLLVVVALAILSSSVYFRALNDNRLTERYLANMRALWLAEAGIARAIENIPTNLSDINENLGGDDYAYFVEISDAGTDLWSVASTGSVALPAGPITKTIKAFVRRAKGDPGKLPNALQTSSNNINFNGTAWTIYGDTCGCSGCDPCWTTGVDVNFTNIFGYSREELKEFADAIYNTANFPNKKEPPLDAGIVFVEVEPGEKLMINGNVTNSPNKSILIVEGDATINGSLDLCGIVYITGKASFLGTEDISGSVLVESDPEIDTKLGGAASIIREQEMIEGAFEHIENLSKSIVAWYESRPVSSRPWWWEEE